jgi:hypothetical protein
MDCSCGFPTENEITLLRTTILLAQKNYVSNKQEKKRGVILPTIRKATDNKNITTFLLVLCSLLL